jgi:hypothetical protein
VVPLLCTVNAASPFSPCLCSSSALGQMKR